MPGQRASVTSIVREVQKGSPGKGIPRHASCSGFAKGIRFSHGRPGPVLLEMKGKAMVQTIDNIDDYSLFLGNEKSIAHFPNHVKGAV